MMICWSCKSSGNQNSLANGNQEHASEISQDTSLRLGAERIEKYKQMLDGKRVGLVVNQTSTIGDVHLVDTLTSLGIQVVTVFAPEHGFRGNHSAGAHVSNGIDEQSGLPIQSLYGKNKKPSAAMLQDIDVMVFDIQDVGVRFYTYISTMHYVMEACAEQGKEVLVLDRPNPNAFYIDGPVLEQDHASFIGMHSIPLVHGLTVGELALMINGEGWLKNGVTCNLSVVPCMNYNHDMLYELPIAPSPNLPNMNSIYLYPYLGLFEGTNVSIGRGTETPFQIVGRPGFNGEISFTPVSIPGVSDHPKYENVTCGGLKVMDVEDGSLFEKKQLNLDWLLLFHKTNLPEDGEYFKSFIHKLSGNNVFKSQVNSGLSAEEIRASWQDDLAEYKKKREKYLLYP